MSPERTETGSSILYLQCLAYTHGFGEADSSKTPLRPIAWMIAEVECHRLPETCLFLASRTGLLSSWVIPDWVVTVQTREVSQLHPAARIPLQLGLMTQLQLGDTHRDLLNWVLHPDPNALATGRPSFQLSIWPYVSSFPCEGAPTCSNASRSDKSNVCDCYERFGAI